MTDEKSELSVKPRVLNAYAGRVYGNGMLFTLNLSSPTGGFAYGIPRKAT